MEELRILKMSDFVTQQVFRRFQSILNKLTKQKFRILVDQAKKLVINTEERLNGVVDLIFEKAIKEPQYSGLYAQMCNHLNAIWVPCADKEIQQVNFRKLLLTKCQKEFEQDTKVELKKLKLLQIKECDEAKKKLLEIEIAEKGMKNKLRRLSLIRFIAELFKLGILIEHIMHDCINKLLNDCDKDSSECLCCLLSVISKKLERHNYSDSTGEFLIKKEVSTLVHLFSEKENQISALKKAEKVLKIDHEEKRFVLNQALEKTKNQCKSLEQEIELKDSKLNASEANVVKLEEDLKLLSETWTKSHSQNQTLELDLTTIRNKLSQLEAENKDLKAKLASRDKKKLKKTPQPPMITSPLPEMPTYYPVGSVPLGRALTIFTPEQDLNCQKCRRVYSRTAFLNHINQCYEI